MVSLSLNFTTRRTAHKLRVSWALESKMKKQKRERHFISELVMAVPFLFVSNGSISSSFSECYLTVHVLELGSRVNALETIDLSVSVVSVDEKESYLCPFVVGQEIQIAKPERAEKLLTAIQPGATLKMRYGTYSGMGENGVAVSGEQWSIIQLVNAQQVQQSENTDTTSGN